MCFNQYWSGSFSLLGLFAACWIKYKTHNTNLALGVFFFFLMEFLQFLQYLLAIEGEKGGNSVEVLKIPGKCGTLNQFLTMLGFLHICLQPYFCHVINASLTRSEKYLAKYETIKRLCLIGAVLLYSRFLLGYFNPVIPFLGKDGAPKGGINDPWSSLSFEDPFESGEWLRAEKLCTYHGKFHLAWGIPMADPSYYIPSANIHFFLMYAPFFALYEKKGMIIQGLFLFLTGPVLASFITNNLMEQASIWCFFSIAQISSMLFLIREVLILNWGTEEARSLLQAQKNDKKQSSLTDNGKTPKAKAGLKITVGKNDKKKL